MLDGAPRSPAHYDYRRAALDALAGVRTIALPMWLLRDLEQHFLDYSEQA